MQAQLILRRARREGSEPLSSVLAPIERLEAEVRRLESLIRELMAFSREQRLDLKTIDPGRFLQQIVDLWQPLASERGIALNLEIEGGYRSIDVDEDKLRRVLDNLVKNALEAITSSPGRVTIRFSLAGAGRVRISVEDTGAGVAPNVQVFRLFETTKANGSGLGLAVARQIIQAHGGDISFSPAEPHGTVFHVELPLLGSSAN
jgi:signal transduction histidine kinase